MIKKQNKEMVFILNREKKKKKLIQVLGFLWMKIWWSMWIVLNFRWKRNKKIA